MSIDETSLFFIICQWVYESTKGQFHADHELALERFYYWLSNHQNKNYSNFLQHSKLQLDHFLKIHGPSLIQYCNNLLNEEPLPKAELAKIKNDLSIIIQNALSKSEKQHILSEFATEILHANDIFHEIAIYHAEGFIRVGLTTDDEHDLKGIEYLHGFEELRHADFIRHSTGKIWYFTQAGIEFLQKLKNEELE